MYGTGSSPYSVWISSPHRVMGNWEIKYKQNEALMKNWNSGLLKI